MLTVLGVLAALGVLFVAVVVATREGEVLLEAPPDAVDLDLPVGEWLPSDIARVRFGMAIRGYRMAEVDEVLARLTTELAARDDQLRALAANRQAEREQVDPPAGAGP